MAGQGVYGDAQGQGEMALLRTILGVQLAAMQQLTVAA